MHEKLDRYDTHAVFIPGTAGVIVALYLHCGSATELMSTAKDFDIGHGIILLFMGYVMGELLQMLGKMYESSLFFFLGGDPLTWIFEPRESHFSKLQIGMRESIGRLVNDATKKQFSDYLSREGKGSHHKLSGPQDLYPLYDKIKSDAYRTEAQKEECLKMLSKSGMYLSFCTLIVLVLAHKIVHACQVGWHLSEWTINPMNGWSDKGHTIPVLIFLSLLLFILTRRFLFFNLRYNQCLITGYLYKNKEEKDTEAAGKENDPKTAEEENGTKTAEEENGTKTAKKNAPVPDESNKSSSAPPKSNGSCLWRLVQIILMVWFIIFLTNIDVFPTVSSEIKDNTNMNVTDEHTHKLLALLEFDGELTTDEKNKLKSYIESGSHLPLLFVLNRMAGNKPQETVSKRTFDEQITFYIFLYRQVKQDCLGEA